MTLRPPVLPIFRACAALAVLAALAIAGCGEDSGGEGDPGAANPKPADVEPAKALADAPPELAALGEQANELLGGGVDAFEARLDELRGHPVVVNKWASWCGPCRFEFPFFQELASERGDEIAFLGIDSDDSEDAARTFLGELPLPYPSYSDPDSEIARSLDADREFPATVFIDKSGKQVHVKRGGYASKDDLEADLERYAR